MPPIRTPAERVGRTLSQLAPGTLGGTLPGAARPVTPVGELRTAPGGGSTGGIVFDFRGRLVTAVSLILPVTTDFTLDHLTAVLRVAGSSSTVVDAEVNGVALGVPATIAAGDTTADSAAIGVRLVTGDLLQMRVTTAGADAIDLTVVPAAA